MTTSGQLGLFNSSATSESPVQAALTPWFEEPFFAVDVETTGLDAAGNRIIELALVPFNMPQQKSFSSLFSIGESLSAEITNITGITDDMLKGQPSFKEVADQVVTMFKQVPFVVAYNAKFDRPFMESELARVDRVLPEIPWVDPFVFICELDRYKRGKKLSDSAKRYGVHLENAHRAEDDARAAGELMLKLADKINLSSLDSLLDQQKIWFWRNAHNVSEYKKSTAWEINR
jgi:DNA polymerase III epsilon subunit family exonuclease